MMAFSWSGQKILLTGGSGFLGSNMQAALAKLDCEVFAPAHAHYDLTDVFEIGVMFNQCEPTVVVHMAGLVGGIGANLARPADFFHENLLMGTLLMQEAYSAGVKKFVAVGAGCGYPEHAPIPTKETDLWNGYPQAPSAPYSLAKRMLVVQAEAMHKQYGFNSVIGMPGNLYGQCFSGDTEVMTVNGIKNIKDIAVGDSVYTLEPDTKKVRLSRVIATQQNMTEEWFNFHANGVNFRVTPDHNMYVKAPAEVKSGAIRYEIKKAEWFRKRAGRPFGQVTFYHHAQPQNDERMNRINLSGYADEEHVIEFDLIEGTRVRDSKQSHARKYPVEFDAGDMAELIGWMVSEGTCGRTRTSKLNGKIKFGQNSIAQDVIANPANRTVILDLLWGMGIHANADKRRIYFSARLLSNFLDAEIGRGAYDKHLPIKLINQMSPRARMRMFKAMMAGDGNKTGGRYTTASTRLKDDFLYLCFLCGVKTGVPRHDGTCWRIPIRQVRQASTVKYKDIVITNDPGVSYCITAERDHIIYAGRNGMFNWVGQCDNFSLDNGHVIPSLVRKFVEAVMFHHTSVTVWGTGKASRDFVYASDVCDGLIKIAEVYDTPELVNLSSGVESSIAEVVDSLVRITGYTGRVVWDKTKPDGQLRRCFDTSKAASIGWRAKVGLEEGLGRTVEWFRANYEGARK